VVLLQYSTALEKLQNGAAHQYGAGQMKPSNGMNAGDRWFTLNYRQRIGRAQREGCPIDTPTY
jgi:hypothetical protein